MAYFMCDKNTTISLKRLLLAINTIIYKPFSLKHLKYKKYIFFINNNRRNNETSKNNLETLFFCKE